MPEIRVGDFTDAPVFVITDLGADPQSQEKTSRAIAAAVNLAAKAGKGRVVIPPGQWPTARTHLKSNVNLHIEEGAELIFSENPRDYLPAVHSSWEGIECYNYSPLIYAYQCKNVAISGAGKLTAKLDVWREWYARPKAHMDSLVELYYMAHRKVPVAERNMTLGEANLRPQFIQFNRCQQVLVENVSIENSPFWVIHPYLCTDVVVRGVSIRAHGHNNDGVDPEMCQNFLIENCIFDQGDDAVSVKSGRDHEAWRLAMPTRNGVIRNCLVRNGHQLLAVGSELSGGIENIFVDNCKIEPISKEANIAPLTNILFIKTNERRGGYVKNIHVSNIEAINIEGGVLCIDTDVLYQWRTLTPTLDKALTAISNIQMTNVKVRDAKFICKINASPELPVKDVKLASITVKKISGEPVSIDNVEGFIYQ
jgi:polygalacturonase